MNQRMRQKGGLVIVYVQSQIGVDQSKFSGDKQHYRSEDKIIKKSVLASDLLYKSLPESEIVKPRRPKTIKPPRPETRKPFKPKIIKPPVVSKAYYCARCESDWTHRSDADFKCPQCNTHLFSREFSDESG